MSTLEQDGPVDFLLRDYLWITAAALVIVAAVVLVVFAYAVGEL